MATLLFWSASGGEWSRVEDWTKTASPRHYVTWCTGARKDFSHKLTYRLTSSLVLIVLLSNISSFISLSLCLIFSIDIKYSFQYAFLFSLSISLIICLCLKVSLNFCSFLFVCLAQSQTKKKLYYEFAAHLCVCPVFMPGIWMVWFADILFQNLKRHQSCPVVKIKILREKQRQRKKISTNKITWVALKETTHIYIKPTTRKNNK